MMGLLLPMLALAGASLGALRGSGRTASAPAFFVAGAAAIAVVSNVQTPQRAVMDVWTVGALPCLLGAAALGLLLTLRPAALATVRVRDAAPAIVGGVLIALVVFAGRVRFLDANLILLGGIAWVWLRESGGEEDGPHGGVAGAAGSLLVGAGGVAFGLVAGVWEWLPFALLGVGLGAILALGSVGRAATDHERLAAVAMWAITPVLAVAGAGAAHVAARVWRGVAGAEDLGRAAIPAAAEVLGARPALGGLGALAPEALLALTPGLALLLAPAIPADARRSLGAALAVVATVALIARLLALA